MATEQVIEDRVLDIFKAQPELMAEEVFPLYEEAYGETSRSNSIHTTISRLTKKGLLYVVRRKQSPLTKKTVNVWKYNDGTTVPVVDASVTSKPTSHQIQAELDVLKARYKNEQESNTKLYGIIERLREENEKLQKENTRLEGELSAEHMNQAGVDL
jgi:predicted transcriptional regulator